MKAFLRTMDFISGDIEDNLRIIKNGEKLLIEIEKDCVDNTYVYSRKTDSKNTRHLRDITGHSSKTGKVSNG